MTKIYSIPTNYQNFGTDNNPNVFHKFERNIIPATKSIVYNPEIQKNKKRNLALKIGGVVLVAGTAIALSSRGVRINLVKLLDSLKAANDDFLNRAKETIANKDLPLLLKAKMAIVRFVNRVTNATLNLIGNLDHGKQYITGKISDNTPIIGPIVRFTDNKLRPFFTGTIIKASSSRYKSAEEAAIVLQKTLNELSAKSPELKQLIGNSGDDIIAALTRLSDKRALDLRVKDVTRLLKEAVREYNAQIDDMVANPHLAQTTGNLLKRTISLDLAKTKLVQKHAALSRLKEVLSFSQKDQVGVLNNLLKEITYAKEFKPDPVFVQKLKQAITSYSKSSTDANREALMKLFKEARQSLNYPQITHAISEAETAITKINPAILQQLVANLEKASQKGLISADEMQNLTKSLSAFQSKLEKAVEFEKTNLAGRLLDIQIGPAPLLETTSLAVPGIVLAAECANSENKQERISKAIVYTPTIVGGLGATIFALNKGLFGIKALGFGLASGYIFNRVGDFIDKNYYSKGKEFNTLKILSSEKPVQPGFRVFEV